MITLGEVQTELQQRLGDSAGVIWSGDELNTYVQEAYDELTIQSGCLFAMELSHDQPLAASFNHAWESEFLESGWEATGPAAFTALWERDWIDNVPGPGNHNHTWEFRDEYLNDPALIPALVELPVELYEIERSTWNTKRVAPLRTRQLEHSDSRYELNKGQVEGYLQDKDGLRKLRKWRVPSAPYNPYAFDFDEGDGFGIIRFMGDISDADVVRG